MGIFKTMTSVFSGDKLIETAEKGIDKAIFTDEEKSDVWLLMLQAYHPFKIAQRYLSFGMLGLMGFGFFLSTGVRVLGSIFCEPVMTTNIRTDEILYYRWWIEDSAWIMTNTIAMFGEPFLYAIGFYFAGGTMNTFVEYMAKRRNKLIGLDKEK